MSPNTRITRNSRILRKWLKSRLPAGDRDGVDPADVGAIGGSVAEDEIFGAGLLDRREAVLLQDVAHVLVPLGPGDGTPAAGVQHDRPVDHINDGDGVLRDRRRDVLRGAR